MSALLEKMRRARETRVEVADFAFIVRRPTPVEMADMSRTRDFTSAVVGWEKVREMDIVPGGDPHPLTFDADACAEWLRDRPDLYGPVIDRVMEAFKAHVAALEEAQKN